MARYSKDFPLNDGMLLLDSFDALWQALHSDDKCFPYSLSPLLKFEAIRNIAMKATMVAEVNLLYIYIIAGYE